MNRPSGLFDAIRYRSFDFRSIHSSASYLPAPFKFLFNYFLFVFFFFLTKEIRKNEENVDDSSYDETIMFLEKERIYNRLYGKVERLRNFNLEIESAYAFIPRHGSPIRRSTRRISRSNEFRCFDSFGNNAGFQGMKVEQWTNPWLYKSLYDYTRVSFHDENNFPNVKSI